MAANRNANVTIIPARQRVGNRKKVFSFSKNTGIFLSFSCRIYFRQSSVFLAKRLMDGLPLKKEGQEHWHRPTILCGRQPRGDYSPRPLYAGAGGDGAEGSEAEHPRCTFHFVRFSAEWSDATVLFPPPSGYRSPPDLSRSVRGLRPPGIPDKSALQSQLLP